VDLIKFLADHGELVFTVTQVAVGGLMLYLSTKFASKTEVASAKARADDAHHQLALMAKDIKGLPDYEKVNKLGDAIARLDRHLAERDGKMDGLVDKVDDLRENLRTLHDAVGRLK
jgi:hypothetical protein